MSYPGKSSSGEALAATPTGTNSPCPTVFSRSLNARAITTLFTTGASFRKRWKSHGVPAICELITLRREEPHEHRRFHHRTVLQNRRSAGGGPEATHHSQAFLSISELVTIGVPQAMKNVSQRAFYHWFKDNYGHPFPSDTAAPHSSQPTVAGPATPDRLLPGRRYRAGRGGQLRSAFGGNCVIRFE